MSNDDANSGFVISAEKEYDSLRNEMGQLVNRQNNRITWVLTVTVALIGYGLREEVNGVVFLTPLILLSFLLQQQVIARLAMVRISTYISNYLESKRGWESRLAVLRRNPPKGVFWGTERSFAFLPIVVGFLCGGMSAYYLIDSFWVVLSIACLVAWLVYSYFILQQLTHTAISDLREKLMNYWEESRDQEVPPSPDRGHL